MPRPDRNRPEEKHATLVVPSAGKNEELLNKVLSEVLNKKRSAEASVRRRQHRRRVLGASTHGSAPRGGSTPTDGTADEAVAGATAVRDAAGVSFGGSDVRDSSRERRRAVRIAAGVPCAADDVLLQGDIPGGHRQER